MNQIQYLESDYEMGLIQKLEDTAAVLAQTGGVSGKCLLRCRKVGYWGTVGESYFE